MKARKQDIKDFFKGIALGFLVVTVMVFVVGCDKKKGGDGRNNPYWYNPGYSGPGWGGNGSVSNVAMGVDNMSGSSLILAIAQDGMGQAWVEGDIELTQPVNCGIDGQIPPGMYRLAPFQDMPGTFMNGFVSANLEAYGPYGVFFVKVPYGQIFNTNVCGFQGLSAGVEIWIPGMYSQYTYCTSMFVSDVGGVCR